RIEHRLRLQHEQRRLARHHAVALRQRDDARTVLAAALALDLIDRERCPQARHEAVARGRRDVKLDRIALLELLAADLAAQHALALDVAREPRCDEYLAAGTRRRQARCRG